MNETLLNVAKILAILLTAGFGALTVWAEDAKKSHLTRKGRLALTASLVSAVIAMVTQALEYRVERDKAVKAAAETQTVLQQISRGIYAFSPSTVLVSVRWQIPLNDAALTVYQHRLIQAAQSLLSTYTIDRLNKPNPNEYAVPLQESGHLYFERGSVNFGPKSKLFPTSNEATARTLFADLGAEINLFVNGSSRPNMSFSTKPAPLIEADFTPRSPEVIDVEANNMEIDLEDYNTDGQIVSLLDLSGVTIEVSQKDLPEAGEDAIRIWRVETLSYLKLEIANKTFFLSGLKKVTKNGFAAYQCQLPKQVEKITSSVGCQ